MMSLSLYTVIVFAVCCAILGMTLLRIGVRGKLISPNPHCRKCKFNLAGHALDDPTPCPECGTILRTQTPSIIIGRYKARKLVLVAAALFLITSIASFAWPKVSKLPSVQNINIYDHFPESLLIKLATGGDDEALQTLHDRLIPGKISTQSLQKLINRAFEVQADENQPWDTRYGDVLLYALVQDGLTPEQINMFLESSIKVHLVAHDQIGPNEVTVYFESGEYSTGAFESDPSFIHKLERESSVVWSPLRLKTFQFAVSRNDQSVNINEQRGVGGESNISFRKGHVSSWRLEEPFSLDESELKINLVTEFTLKAGDHVLHTWLEERSHTYTRSDTPIEYSKSLTDHEEIREIVNAMRVDRLAVPIKLAQAEKHQRTKHFGLSKFMLNTEGPKKAALIGKIYFRLGDHQIKFRDTNLNFIPNPDAAPNTYYGVHSNNMNLDFYKENRLFWMQAIMYGSVDIVIYPDIEEYAKRPSVDQYISTPIIFRDVPITRYEPGYGGVQDHQGNRWEEWRWTRVGGSSKSDPIHGEILEDE